MAKTAERRRLSRPMKKKATKKQALRRYTNLAATIHLLQTGQITLLNPAAWDDKNDAYFMAEYKRKLGAQTVLALCFAESDETYHHWRVFSNGGDGVCIEFDKESLVTMFQKFKGVHTGKMAYKRINALKSEPRIDVKELPFLKRLPYQDEREFRVVYVDMKDAQEFRNFPTDLTWINRITLSPWMSKTLRDSVAKTLRSIPDCKHLRVIRSTLVGNNEWQAITAGVK